MSESTSCIFCSDEYKNTFPNIIAENELAYAALDNNPISKGHALIISKKHYEQWFLVPRETQVAMLDLLDEAKEILEEKNQPDGYNVGINCGLTAGQTVFHVHVHIIPRYVGDTEDPTGGIKTALIKQLERT